ncbi:MAG: hypothetical protein ACHQ2F_03470 [Desulfobaccales bacterium]
MRQKWKEAGELRIAPPRSASPLDMMEYETRAMERRELIKMRGPTLLSI